MSRGFLPDSDPALLAWSLNFGSKINLAPATYGLTALLAGNYQTVHDAFAAALAACDPGDRSKSLVAAKNSVRATLKTQARLLAKLVEGTASVTDAQKIELGLNVRARPTPVPAPSTSPDIDVVSVNGRTVTVRVHDSTVPRRSKPDGVKGATIFSFVGPTPPSDPDGWKFETSTTLKEFSIQFPDSVAAGTRVWITAFWFNTKSESGPAAAPVGAYIQYGAMSMAA